MRTPTGPTSLIDGFKALAGFQRDIPAFLAGITRDYGSMVRFRFGVGWLWLANSSETLREVLVEQAPKLHKTALTKQLLAPSLGNGLLISDGEFWKRQRRLIQPAFHARRIEGYARTMVDDAAAMLATWRSGETRDIGEAMMRLTLTIVTNALFGSDLTDQEIHDIARAVDVSQRVAAAGFRSGIPLPMWLPTKSNRDAAWAIRTIEGVVYRLIRDRRANREDRGDLLSMLLLAADDDGTGMTDRQVRDEVYTLLVAGHETTAVTLMWTWILLSQHPEVEARLHAELDRELGGRAPTVADLPKLVYAEQVLKEAMRLYPAAHTTGREAAEDVQIGGHTLRKGDTVLVSPWVVHHDPRVWPDPERFDPDRFAPGQEPGRFAYLPFGAGPRICIGNAFSMMEARLLLAAIAQRFKLSMPPGTHIDAEPLVTLRPKGTLTMTVTARNP